MDAMNWALNKSPVTSATDVLILCALANNADEYGEWGGAPVEKIASFARCTVNKVYDRLDILARRGVITPVESNRMQMWNLNMSMTREVRN